jgi:hypothetical protein
VISLYGKTESSVNYVSKSTIGDSILLDPVRLLIIDARTKMAAKCNWATGGGHEKAERYPGCTLKFMDIYNIHEMRKSFRQVTKLCQDPANQDRRLFEQTQWLEHTKTVLKASKKLAKFVENGKCILVHCSDGWDRTSQIVALTEFMLDPYYRTIYGFGILIQKEWLSFGHKFKNRLGQGQPEDYTQEQSPIFIQFMDCVYQLLMQYPNWFEFNEEYLISILDHLYSGRFGTFLSDSERENETENLNENTLSLWPWLLLPENLVRFKNAEFYPYNGPIYPKCATLFLNVWAGYYERYKLSMVQHHEHNKISLQRNLSRTKLRLENQKLKEEIEKNSEKINNYEKILKNVIQKDLLLQETIKELDPSKPIELILNCTPEGNVHCLISRSTKTESSPCIVKQVSSLSDALQENYVPHPNSNVPENDSSDSIEDFISVSPGHQNYQQRTLSRNEGNPTSLIRLFIPSYGDYITLSLGKVMNWIKSSR